MGNLVITNGFSFFWFVRHGWVDSYFFSTYPSAKCFFFARYPRLAVVTTSLFERYPGIQPEDQPLLRVWLFIPLERWNVVIRGFNLRSPVLLSHSPVRTDWCGANLVLWVFEAWVKGGSLVDEASACFFEVTSLIFVPGALVTFNSRK